MGLGGLDYRLGDLDLFVYRLTFKEDYIFQGSRGPGSPGHINYHTLGRGGLDYYFEELNLFIHQREYKRKLHIPKVPGPRAPQTILITILPGFLGYAIVHAFSMITTQVQASQMIIQATKP